MKIPDEKGLNCCCGKSKDNGKVYVKLERKKERKK